MLEPLFADFGGKQRFSGEIVTIKCFEDNSLVGDAVRSPGEGQRNINVTFAGATIRSGAWLYADANGVVVARSRLDVEF